MSNSRDKTPGDSGASRNACVRAQGGEAWTEPYGSDLRLRVKAPDREKAFSLAALLLGRVIAEPRAAAEAEGGEPWRERRLELRAEDDAALLVVLLEELLFLFETEGLLPAALEILRLEAGRLSARLRCAPFDPARHAPGRGVKAVTWHDLLLEDGEDGVALAVVLDL